MIFSFKKTIYHWISNHFMKDCSSYNSLAVRRGCRSKKQARDMFNKGNIPHAEGLIFFNPFNAIKFAKKHGFPVVLKPNVGGFSRGSHFPITSYRQLWKAIFLSKLWWPTAVIEQYLEGKNYRVLVKKGSIISIIERFSPFVEGDGVKDINTLIDEENSIRERMNLYPCIYPLTKGKTTKQYLKKSAYTLESVPEKGAIVKLFYRISLASGGVVRVVEKNAIAEVNKQLFLDTLNLFDANILGIDAIFEKNIETSYQEQHCIFLEVNSRPYIKMHHFPRYGVREDVSSYFHDLDQLKITQSDTF